MNMNTHNEFSSPLLKTNKLQKRVKFQDIDPKHNNKENSRTNLWKSKISPLKKESIKSKLLKFCIDRTKKSRYEYFNRLRVGNITSKDLAMEILNDTMTIDSSPFYDDEMSHVEVLRHIDEMKEQEIHERIMCEIYESICNELSNEIENTFYDGYDDDIDWNSLEDLDIPSDLSLLCPFCRKSNLETDFINSYCYCKCGICFSFISKKNQISSIPDLKNMLSLIYERHHVICQNINSHNPSLSLDFQIVDQNVHAWCGECGFHELIF